MSSKKGDPRLGVLRVCVDADAVEPPAAVAAGGDAAILAAAKALWPSERWTEAEEDAKRQQAEAAGAAGAAAGAAGAAAAAAAGSGTTGAEKAAPEGESEEGRVPLWALAAVLKAEKAEAAGGSSSAPVLALVGFPHDAGVARNGGRVGACGGPAVVRRALLRTGTVRNPEEGVDLAAALPAGRWVDAGDAAAPPSWAPTLEAHHGVLRRRVAALIRAGCVPFVVGGGNDQSYPNAAALLDLASAAAGVPAPVPLHADCSGAAPADAPPAAAVAELAGERQVQQDQKKQPLARVAAVNIDAHLDARPLLEGGMPHSGSPFRQLLEDPRFVGRNFHEYAAQGAQCSATHADYVTGKGAEITWLGQIQARGDQPAQFRRLIDELAARARAVDPQQGLEKEGQPEPAADGDSTTASPLCGAQGEGVFVSFDIDSIAARDCPGVSAPAPIGLSAEDALAICRIAGAHPDVTLVDMSEFNPVAETTITAKLIARCFYEFALGLASRGKKTSA